MQWKKSNAEENEYKISLRKMLQPSNTYSSSSSSSTHSGSSTMPMNSSMKMEEKQTLINKNINQQRLSTSSATTKRRKKGIFSALRIEPTNKSMALTQFCLKSFLCILGWHALFTIGLTIRLNLHDPERISNYTEYEYTNLAFSLYFIITLLDIIWHLDGLWSEWIHHGFMSCYIYIAYTMSPLFRTYMVINGIMETVAPVYQMIKWGKSPFFWRRLAVFVNLCIRMPYVLFFSVPILWYDVRMSLYDKIVDEEGLIIIPWIWFFGFFGCVIFLALDYFWTKALCHSIKRKERGKMKWEQYNNNIS